MQFRPFKRPPFGRPQKMNTEIKTYSLDVIVEPKPALLLTYSYSDQETRRHKRLMPVRDLHRLANVDIDQLTGVEVFGELVDQLKQRHSLHLNAVDDAILIKVIIVLCGLINNRLELDQCLSYADRLLKDFKGLNRIDGEINHSGDKIEHLNDLDESDHSGSLAEANGSDKATGSKEERKSGTETKKKAKQVRFRDNHTEFVFQRFESEESDELIDNLNDKDFLDSMFKNELNHEDLNNNYQPVNYNQ